MRMMYHWANKLPFLKTCDESCLSYRTHAGFLQVITKFFMLNFIDLLSGFNSSPWLVSKQKLVKLVNL